MKNIFKKIISIFTICIMASQAQGVYADSTKELESGIYEVKNDVFHDSEIGMSMARTYTDENMDMKIENEKIEYTVKFTGTDYMENYRIVVNDEEVEFEIVSESEEDHSITLKYEVSSLEDKMEAHIYVDAMGRDVQFGIIPREDTINLIEKIEEPKEEVVEESDNTSSEVTSESNSNSSIYMIGGAIVVVMIIGFFIIKNRK